MTSVAEGGAVCRLPRGRPRRCGTNLGLGVLFGLPALELLEQRILVGFGLNLARGLVLLEEFLEFIATDRVDVVLVKPSLGGREALPAVERRRQRDFLPFGMEWRVLELRELGEEIIDEQR